jgi:hypothetical protein
VAGRFELLHLPFSSARRLVRIFCSVVQPLVLAMVNSGHDPLFAAPQLASLSLIMTRSGRICFFSRLAQQPLGGLPVAAALHQDVEHDTGLVHSSPQPVLHPANLENDLVEMPFIAHSRKATTDLVGELPAEFARPLSYSFVADDDAARGQQFLHHAQTEWKAEYSHTAWPMISAGNRDPP